MYQIEITVTGNYRFSGVTSTALPQYLQAASFQGKVRPQWLHFLKYPRTSRVGRLKCSTIRKKGNTPHNSPHSNGFLPRDRASLKPSAAGRPNSSSKKIISFINITR